MAQFNTYQDKCCFVWPTQLSVLTLPFLEKKDNGTLCSRILQVTRLRRISESCFLLQQLIS